jgi:hypothetical protein
VNPYRFALARPEAARRTLRGRLRRLRRRLVVWWYRKKAYCPACRQRGCRAHYNLRLREQVIATAAHSVSWMFTKGRER